MEALVMISRFSETGPRILAEPRGRQRCTRVRELDAHQYRHCGNKTAVACQLRYFHGDYYIAKWLQVIVTGTPACLRATNQSVVTAATPPAPVRQLQGADDQELPQYVRLYLTLWSAIFWLIPGPHRLL